MATGNTLRRPIISRWRDKVSYGICALVGITLFLGGISSEKRKAPHPDKLDYSLNPPMVRDLSMGGIGEECYIWDLDKDGKADAMGFRVRAHWVFPGYEGKVDAEDARKMTPEIRAAASDFLQKNRDLTRLMAKEAYEADNFQEDR